MNYRVLKTGSKGNATIVEDIILIDCGVPYKDLEESVKKLQLVLLTHIHSDHFNKSTIRRLAKNRPTLRFGCGEWLVEELVKCGVDKRNIDVYRENDTNIYNKNLSIKINQLFHDVPNCCYHIMINGFKYFYATDTCSLKDIIAKDYNVYFVEANYVDKAELDARKRNHIENGEFYYEDRVEKTHLSMVNAWDWLINNKNENSTYIWMHEHIDNRSEL